MAARLSAATRARGFATTHGHCSRAAETAAGSPWRGDAGGRVRVAASWSAVALLGHGPSPRPRLDASALDEFPESLEVALGPPLDEPEGVADVLDRTVRVDVDLERHPGQVVAKPMERDNAGILRSVDRRPGDPLIRDLLGDAGVPGPLLAGDARLPTECRVV